MVTAYLVTSNTAINEIRTISCCHIVISGVTEDRINTITTTDNVIAFATNDLIVPGVTLDCVVPDITFQNVIAGATIQVIISMITTDGVVSVCAIHGNSGCCFAFQREEVLSWNDACFLSVIGPLEAHAITAVFFEHFQFEGIQTSTLHREGA